MIMITMDTYSLYIVYLLSTNNKTKLSFFVSLLIYIYINIYIVFASMYHTTNQENNKKAKLSFHIL